MLLPISLRLYFPLCRIFGLFLVVSEVSAVSKVAQYNFSTIWEYMEWRVSLTLQAMCIRQSYMGLCSVGRDNAALFFSFSHITCILPPAGLSLMTSRCFVCILCLARPPCCFVIKYMTCSDSSPEIVLGHVKCPAMRRHRTSFIVLVALVSMHAQE